MSADRGVGDITFFMPSTQVDPSSNTILIPIGLGLVGALLHSEWASGPKIGGIARKIFLSQTTQKDVY